MSPCPHVQCKGAAFLDPVSAPHQVLSVHCCPFPHILPWSSHNSQPALDISSQRNYEEQRECLKGLRCTQLSPFTWIHDWQQWLLPLSLPLAPFAAHLFHFQSKVTECSTKLCVRRSLTPVPQVPLHETLPAAS